MARNKAPASNVSPINQFSVEWWDIERPVDYPLNARKWKPAAVAKVAASLKAYGWRQPVVVDDVGVIVIGHLRRAAARQAGLTQVPVHVAAGLSPEAIRGLRLADNRTHDEAEWDMELLAREFGELKALDFDLAATAFSLREIDALTLKPNAAEDEVPPVPEVPITKPGDLWILGEHRLLCGDSLDMEWKYDAILTDPPYGVGVEYDGFVDTSDGVRALIPRIMSAVSRCQCALITSGVPNAWLYPQPAWLLCWVHPAPTGGCPWGFSGVNPILAYGKDPWLTAGLGRHPDSVVMSTDRAGVEGHPTPKPLKVWLWMLNRISPKKTDTIYDPFGGSGTTIIAGEHMGRKVLSSELSPRYCDVIVKRWENLTGKKAELCRT